jgi:single-stranded DNA-binding protein
MKFYGIVRLCKDAMEFTNGCQLSVAENNPYAKDEAKKTDFYNLKAFSKTAETISKFCHKGDQVFIEGHTANNNYEKDGVKVYRDDFIVDHLGLLSNKRDEAPTPVSVVPKDKYVDITDKEIEDLPF